jgi:hypothetical protein
LIESLAGLGFGERIWSWPRINQFCHANNKQVIKVLGDVWKFCQIGLTPAARTINHSVHFLLIMKYLYKNAYITTGNIWKILSVACSKRVVSNTEFSDKYKYNWELYIVYHFVISLNFHLQYIYWLIITY